VRREFDVSEPLRLLIAISGAEDPALVGFVARVAGAGGSAVDLTLLHVVDAEARMLAGEGLAMRHAPWPARSQGATDRRLDEADEAGASALLAAWKERFEAEFPAAVAIAGVVRRGRPEQSIVLAAQELRADAIVLSARPGPRATEPGPRSVGHVARFVLDHSPVPVLLVRGSVLTDGEA
jgi:nucleotide-binding universal stress UspA family protein